MDPNQNNPANSTPVGDQPGSQPAAPAAPANTPDDGGANPNPTNGGDIAGQISPEQFKTLQDENARLRGQVSSVQKKYMESVRGNMNKPNMTPPNPGNGANPNSDPNMDVMFTAMDLATAKILPELETSVFPLYDGSMKEFEGQPALPAQEFSRIRKNPWAFVSREALSHALTTGDLAPAKLEIEQAIADRVDSLSSNTPTPKTVPTPVNPNPAPAAPGNPAPTPQGQSKNDLWNMPMDQLEQLNSQAVNLIQNG